MKKVLFFVESLGGGGAEKVLTDLVKYLDESKYEVYVTSISDCGVYSEILSRYCHFKPILHSEEYANGGLGRMVYSMKYKFIYGMPASIVYRYIMKDKFDVEVAFIEGFATKIIAASQNKNSRKIAWIHIDMQRNPYANRVYFNQQTHIQAYQQFDRICCVSRKVKEVFHQLFFDDSRVCIQYNPVDSEDVLRKGKEPISLTKNSTLQLGTIGRLEEQKGFVRLLEILGQLRHKGYDFGLWIAGEGSQRKQLEEIIKKYHMEQQVILLGFQTNPYKYMEKCDLFICSSYAEGFSTAATESLILGKPIFTTDCAGMNELFGNEKCGEIVPNTDEALYEMLEKLLSNTWEPVTYIEAVNRRALDFDIKIRMREIEDILDME